MMKQTLTIFCLLFAVTVSAQNKLNLILNQKYNLTRIIFGTDKEDFYTDQIRLNFAQKYKINDDMLFLDVATFKKKFPKIHDTYKTSFNTNDTIVVFDWDNKFSGYAINVISQEFGIFKQKDSIFEIKKFKTIYKKMAHRHLVIQNVKKNKFVLYDSDNPLYYSYFHFILSKPKIKK